MLSRIRIGDLFKIRSFKNLHIGRVSLLDKLNKKFHDVKHSILHDLKKELESFSRHLGSLRGVYTRYLIKHQVEYLNALEKLVDFTHWTSHLLMGIDQLSTGNLSAALLHP